MTGKEERIEINKELVFAISELELFKKDLDGFEEKYIDLKFENKDSIKLQLIHGKLTLNFENYELREILCSSDNIDFKEVISKNKTEPKGKVIIKTPSSKIIIPEKGNNIRCELKRSNHNINKTIQAMYINGNVFNALSIKECIRNNFPEFV
jgi:hypothetical protein